MKDLGGSKGNPDQLAQPAGMPTSQGTQPGVQVSADVALLDLYGRYCGYVPDVAERLRLLGVPATVEIAWQQGRMLPALRARRKPIQNAVIQFERAAAAED